MKGYKLSLRDLTSLDSGNYTCIISNRHGFIEWTYTLKVLPHLPHAPIINGPKNQTVRVGEDAVFTCVTVHSGQNPRIKWLQHYKVNGSYTTADGDPYVTVLQTSKLNTSRSGQLVLRNVTMNMAGCYTCVVQNSIGITFGSAWLTVVEGNHTYIRGKPEWSSKKPDHHTIARPANSYVHLKCPALGHPKPKIEWLFNRKAFLGTVAGQWSIKGYKLTLGGLTPKDSGKYTCIVRNTYGSIEWTYTLEVVPRFPHAPVIEGPKNQTVKVGEDVVFNCKITLSDLRPHVQWLHHYKVNGSYTTAEGEPYVTVLQTSNSNTSRPGQLVLRNVKMDMAGWYTCFTQNSIGIGYRSAWLSVVEAVPHFNRVPDRIHVVLVGESIKLRCKVSGRPKTFLHWFKEGKHIEHLIGSRMKMKRFALIIENIQLNDTGNYSCLGKNQHGLVWGNFTVTVHNTTDALKNTTNADDDEDDLDYSPGNHTYIRGKPEWSSKKPDHHTIARPANSYVDLKCPALGHPKPKIEWLFNRKAFLGTVAGQWFMKGYKLTLGGLTPKDSGKYTCIVRNTYGSIEWTYTLEVVPRFPHAPVIEGPKNQTVKVGEDVVFNCKIILSDLRPHVQWLHHYKVNGSYTTAEGEPYVTVLQTSNSNTSRPGQLVLRNVKMDMAGWYTCFTQNSIGIGYRSAWLSVVEAVPHFNRVPDRIHVVLVGESIKLRCKVSGRPEPFLHWFKEGKHIEHLIGSRMKMKCFALIIENIQLNDTGNYSCLGKNQHGVVWGNFTVTVHNTTDALKNTTNADDDEDDLDYSPAAPHFNRVPELKHAVLVGESIKLRCKVSGRPKPYLHWFKEGKRIEHLIGSRMKMSRFALIIENIQLNDTGNYSCRGQNQHGVVWGNFSVTAHGNHTYVRGKPEWSSRKPDHHTIARPANSYVDLKCPALGHPKPKIEWLFNRKAFLGTVAGQWSMKGYKLRLGDLTPEDSGKYTCIVSNTYGSIEWTYTLEVVPRFPHAPVIEGPKNQTVKVGEDAVFNCKIVLGDLFPHFQWLKHYKVNGSYTTAKGDPYLTVLQTPNSNMSRSGQLVLRNVTMNTAGWYTCAVQNSIGIEYGSAWLSVVEGTRDPDRTRLSKQRRRMYTDAAINDLTNPFK